MTILNILRMGTSILRQTARPVEDFDAPQVQTLVDDMIETLRDTGGVGLAAPQVGVPLRVIIYHVPAWRNGGNALPLSVLINPEIRPLDPALQVGYEGCLSVPGLTGAVPRWMQVAYTGLTRDGSPVEGGAEGFHARVLQHECDHLDGVLYVSRMGEYLDTLGFADEVRQSLEEGL